MGTITRTITVDNLDDVADAIKEQVTSYRESRDRQSKGRITRPEHYPLNAISEATNILFGLELAERIVRDCKFRRDDL